MAWQDEMRTILRVMINDVAEVTYTDNSLETILLVGARQVGLEMKFSQNFVSNITSTSITPDPTDDVNGTRDDSYINLTCLKAACIIDRGEAKTTANQAINLVDNSSRVDLTETARAKIKLLEKGWCAVYDDAKLEYLSGQSRVAGAAVMTPFRIFAGSNAGYGYYPYEGRSPYNSFP